MAPLHSPRLLAEAEPCVVKPGSRAASASGRRGGAGAGCRREPGPLRNFQAHVAPLFHRIRAAGAGAPPRGRAHGARAADPAWPRAGRRLPGVAAAAGARGSSRRRRRLPPGVARAGGVCKRVLPSVACGPFRRCRPRVSHGGGYSPETGSVSSRRRAVYVFGVSDGLRVSLTFETVRPQPARDADAPQRVPPDGRAPCRPSGGEGVVAALRRAVSRRRAERARPAVRRSNVCV